MAVTALIRKGTLFVANVGDSRAIIGQEFTGKLIAYPLSADQTPFRKDERERVKAAGAVVANMDQMDGIEPMHENWTEAKDADDDEDDDTGDPPRVWVKNKMLPGCAFTRSIGDSIGESVGVFAEPEVVTKELSESDKYIIIASDGVWEFLTNQTVLNMVAAYKSPLKACKAVVNEAYKLWLQYDVRTDDITMIAIYLEEMGGLANAHASELATLEKESADAASNAAEKRQKLRELRRKSSAIVDSKGHAGVAAGVTGNAKKVEAEDARPVRRVMTKEKRKVIMSTSEEKEKDWSEQKERGFTYELSGRKVADTELEEIGSAVATNFLLSHLNKEQQKEVFCSMEECSCKTGDTIIQVGQPGEWFYVVQTGTYDAFIDGALIHTYRIEEVSESGKHGVSFGELALLYMQQARAATITCCEEGKLWRLHAKTFRDIVMRSSTQQLLRTLRSVEVLRELTLSQLQRLFDALSEVKAASGQFIVKEGEPGRDFFVVMEGEATVLKKRPTAAGGGEEEVMVLKQYDYFGERALLNDAPRAASVRASTPMKLLQISKLHFEEVLGSLDEIIDSHRRKREEGARRAYLQRQAEGLLDATSNEFTPVAKLASWNVSDIYVVQREEKLPEDEDAKPGSFTSSCQRLVVRLVSKKKATDASLRSRVMSEIKLIGDMMPSTFVPSLLATFSDRAKMYAVMGCILACDLSSVVKSRAMVELEGGEKSVRFYTAAVMMALLHLHRQEIVVRMISVDSIMLDSKGYPQLIDFTLSKKLTEGGGRTFTLCGIPEYNAPEQVSKAGHGTASDWWALGIFCYELLVGSTPFAVDVDEQKDKAEEKKETPPTAEKAKGAADRRPTVARLLVTAVGGELETTVATYKSILAYAKSEEHRLDYPKTSTAISKQAKDFIEDLLDPDPIQRLGCRGGGFEEIEVHAWFDGFNFVSLEDGSSDAPFQQHCQEEATKFFKDGPSGSKQTFEAPPYVGDNRWCDDWDYTCTIGATVESSTEDKGKPNTFAGRRASSLAAVVETQQ